MTLASSNLKSRLVAREDPQNLGSEAGPVARIVDRNLCIQQPLRAELVTSFAIRSTAEIALVLEALRKEVQETRARSFEADERGLRGQRGVERTCPHLFGHFPRFATNKGCLPVGADVPAGVTVAGHLSKAQLDLAHHLFSGRSRTALVYSSPDSGVVSELWKAVSRRFLECSAADIVRVGTWLSVAWRWVRSGTHLGRLRNPGLARRTREETLAHVKVYGERRSPYGRPLLAQAWRHGMRIATILDHIDSGHMALPEFQRGYVWNRDQVRGLFDSLYRRHPVGGLLVWVTASETAVHRGKGDLAAGVVKLLLDGQQRMTSLYGVVRGKAPTFFDGNEAAFTGLHFHLDLEAFEFYQPLKMKDDPLWIDVTDLMRKGNEGLGALFSRPAIAANLGAYAGRLTKLLGVTDIELHVDEVTGPDKSIDVVVDIFNRVNSGGTKLSKGDLALAKICADWPGARDAMKAKLEAWETAGYFFNRDWLLRSVNTVLTGEAQFQHLHEKSAREVEDALDRAARHIDSCLNHIGGRLGLDHDRVFFGRFAVPVMARYLDQRESKKLGAMNEKERDKLLFWFVQAAMWGRFSGSTESVLDQDLAAVEEGLDRLLGQLRLWQGSLRAESEHFTASSVGARFYPVLYMLTRMGEARDWGTGLPLKASMLGAMSRLEVHHIFPKSQLYKRDYPRAEVNALANFCFLTKDTNPRHRQPAARGLLPRDRTGPSGRAGVAVDSGRSGLVAGRALPRFP